MLVGKFLVLMLEIKAGWIVSKLEIKKREKNPTKQWTRYRKQEFPEGNIFWPLFYYAN